MSSQVPLHIDYHTRHSREGGNPALTEETLSFAAMNARTSNGTRALLSSPLMIDARSASIFNSSSSTILNPTYLASLAEAKWHFFDLGGNQLVMFPAENTGGAFGHGMKYDLKFKMTVFVV